MILHTIIVLMADIELIVSIRAVSTLSFSALSFLSSLLIIGKDQHVHACSKNKAWKAFILENNYSFTVAQNCVVTAVLSEVK